MKYNIISIAIVVISITIAACGDDNSTALNNAGIADNTSNNSEQIDDQIQNNSDEAVVNNQDSDIQPSSTPIPLYSDAPTSCVYREERPVLSICEWAMSVDNIAIGYVTDVTLVDSPAQVSITNGPVIDGDECDGTLNPTIKVTINVDKSIEGNRMLDDTIEIHIGRRQFVGWSSVPEGLSDDGIEWREPTRTPRPGAKIEAGQYLGFPIHYVEDDGIWSLMGEQTFSLEQTKQSPSAIQFQGKNASCTDDYPPAMNGMSVDEFIAQTATCESSEDSTRRRNMMRNRFGRDIAGYRGATCSSSSNVDLTP